MKNTSYWEETSFFTSYDLIVVGAGIVGLSSALFYKQHNPDARVAVLDRGFIPRGASTRNAGFACVGSIGEHLADIRKGGESEVKERIRQRYEGLRLLKKTLGEDAIGYEHCGGYEFFRSQNEFEEVAPEVGRFNQWMSDLIGEDEVYGADEIEGYPVIKNRLEGALHPGRMMQRLVQMVSGAGVEVRWNCPVDTISSRGEVHVESGPVLNGGKVLVAANGFVRRLLPEMSVKPARGYVLVTEKRVHMPWKGIFHHDGGYIYFRNVDDRLLIGGARNLDKKGEETDKFGVNTRIKTHLIDFVSNVLGFSDDWQIEYQWSGIMGFTPTKTPVIKQLDEHRLVAAGLSGMGIAIGMKVGRRASGLL